MFTSNAFLSQNFIFSSTVQQELSTSRNYHERTIHARIHKYEVYLHWIHFASTSSRKHNYFCKDDLYCRFWWWKKLIWMECRKKKKWRLWALILRISTCGKYSEVGIWLGRKYSLPVYWLFDYFLGNNNKLWLGRVNDYSSLLSRITTKLSMVLKMIKNQLLLIVKKIIKKTP